MTAPEVLETGVCRGCGAEKRLRSDGKVRDHLPPLDQRRAGDSTPCAGGGLAAEGETARPPAPPVIVKVPVERATARGQCRICGRLKPVAADGRLRSHLDADRLACDGAGKLPQRTVTS